MRRFTKLQRILILFISVFFLFGCLMLSVRQNSISNIGYSAWTYLRYGLFDKPLTSAANAVSDFPISGMCTVTIRILMTNWPTSAPTRRCMPVNVTAI